MENELFDELIHNQRLIYDYLNSGFTVNKTKIREYNFVEVFDLAKKRVYGEDILNEINSLFDIHNDIITLVIKQWVKLHKIYEDNEDSWNFFWMKNYRPNRIVYEEKHGRKTLRIIVPMGLVNRSNLRDQRSLDRNYDILSIEAVNLLTEQICLEIPDSKICQMLPQARSLSDIVDMMKYVGYEFNHNHSTRYYTHASDNLELNFIETNRIYDRRINELNEQLELDQFMLNLERERLYYDRDRLERIRYEDEQRYNNRRSYYF